MLIDKFERELVHHQVKYLGLMENLRVRRAGFAYRRLFTLFLKRYKCLSSETWPNYKGDERQGVQVLVRSLGYSEDDYKMGKYVKFLFLFSNIYLLIITERRFS